MITCSEQLIKKACLIALHDPLCQMGFSDPGTLQQTCWHIHRQSPSFPVSQIVQAAAESGQDSTAQYVVLIGWIICFDLFNSINLYLPASVAIKIPSRLTKPLLQRHKWDTPSTASTITESGTTFHTEQTQGWNWGHANANAQRNSRHICVKWISLHR